MTKNAKDGSDNRAFEHFVEDTQRLLQVKVTNIHTRRALLYKVSEDVMRLSVPRWTKAAWLKYEKNLQERKTNPKVNPYAGLHREHPVPKSVVTNWLCSKDHRPQDPVDAGDVLRAIKLFMVTCWVTGPKHKQEDKENWGSEQDLLDSTWGTIKCKDNMPEGWCRMHGDVWDRYRFVRQQPESKLSDLTEALEACSPCECPQDSPNRVR